MNMNMNTTQKTVTVISKRKANAMLVDSLFNAGGTLTATKLCSGKYATGKFPVGREIEVSENIVAVWAENRKDSCGPYVSLYCLCK
jgi:hypothetical protein